MQIVRPRCCAPLLLAMLAACTSSAGSGPSEHATSSTTTPTAKPEVEGPAPTGDGSTPTDSISDELRRKVCSTENTDETSKIYLARTPDGVVTRLSVTPRSDLADAGNSIFDMDGKLLGEDTGGEFPWDNEDALAKERARVAELMAGAEVTDGQTPLSCK